MISRLKARYSKGVIVPMEALDIEEGANLFVSVEVETRDVNSSLANEEECFNQRLDDLDIEDCFEKARDSSSPTIHTINDAFDEIRESLAHIPKETGPTDGAKNYKHYLYGRPKED